VAFDTQPNNPQANAELVDANGSSITLGAIPLSPRSNAVAARLKNGNVLLSGGTNGLTGCPGTMAETYDVAGNVFISNIDLAGPLGHTVTVLLDGRALIAGGIVGYQSSPLCALSPVNGQTENAAFLFDPRDGTLKRTGDLFMSRRDHNALLLADGRVLLVGGDDNPNAQFPAPSETLEIYDPTTGSFTYAGIFPQDGASPAAPRRIAASIILANDEVLLFAMGSSPSFTPVWTLYDPMTQSFSPLVTISGSEIFRSSVYLLPNSEVLFVPLGGLAVYKFK
jgi:hypothetical protein